MSGEVISIEEVIAYSLDTFPGLIEDWIGGRGNPERALGPHGRRGTPALPGGPGRVERPRRGLLA
jgi:hypothetical protein